MIDMVRASADLPEVAGVLTKEELLATGSAIAAVQRPDGMIPWFEGDHCDPWNHVESAMALTVCGLHDEALRAYDWIINAQLGDGSWFNYYFADGSVKDARLDTNVCAYIATGAWHHFLVTGALDHLERMWPAVERAVEFVLRWQGSDGSIAWAIDPAGRRERYSLLAGSSSIFHSLRCAIAAAELLGKERPHWELAAGRLGHLVRHHPETFAPKSEFAMDWYYPVLSGALGGPDGAKRIEQGWEAFVLAGSGVRCVSGSNWVTAAETAECVLALDALGVEAAAVELFAAGQQLRLVDGSYWTGLAFPERRSFPADERTTYTAAAMVLAADALSRATPASGLFRGEGLPAPLDLADPDCPLAETCPRRVERSNV